MAGVVALWAPVILRHLPSIMSVLHDLYATWCTMRGTSHNNSVVLKAMKLLMKHQNNLNTLYQNPNEKRQLLEGLTILINRINQSGPTEGGAAGDGPGCGFNSRALGPPPPSAPSSSSSEYPSKGRRWRMCDVCFCEYNSTNRKPMILSCGHTFCRECLREIFNRNLNCPTCRQRDARPFSSLPANVGLLRLLEDDDDEDLKKKDDKSSCFNSNGGASACGGDIPFSYDDQIEYAIFLSMRTAETQGQEFVEAKWREVECAGDEMLAEAICLSEIYEDSRISAQRHQEECARDGLDECAQRNQDECARRRQDECAQNQQDECGQGKPFDSDMNLSDKEEQKSEGATSGGHDEEEASLRLALELQHEEIAWMRRMRGGDGDCANGGGCGDSREDSHWMKEVNHYFGSFCNDRSEEDPKNNSGQDKRNLEERDECMNDGESAMCCSRGEEDAKKDDGGECQTRGTSADEPTNCCGKEDEEKDHCGKSENHCLESEDDAACCGKSQEEWKKGSEDGCCVHALEKKREQEKYAAMLREQEDSLIKFVLQQSLKDFQNGAEKDADMEPPTQAMESL